MSQALRGLPGPSPHRRKAILAAARELGYHRAALEDRLPGVVMCLPDATTYSLTNPFFTEVVRGLISGLGPQVPLCVADIAAALAPERDFGFRDPVFVVVSPDDVAARSFVPDRTVLVDTVSETWPAVTMDNEAAGRMVTQYLLTLGHRDIAFLGSRPTHTARMRLRGFEAALLAAGEEHWDRLVVETTGSGVDDGASTAVKVLGRATAMVAFNDVMAVGAIHALADRGVAVPGDVSVVSFDDSPMAALIRPALSTMHQPAFEEGRAAATLAARMLDGEAVAGQSTLTLAGHLVLRESAARPQAAAAGRELAVEGARP